MPIPQLELAASSEIAYNLPGKNTTGRRSTVLLPATHGGTDVTSGGGLVRFKLPPQEYLDGSTVVLNIRIKAPSASSTRLGGGMATLLKRVRLLDGSGNVIENVDNYNVLHNMINRMIRDRNWWDSYGAVLEGYTPPHNPEIQLSAITKANPAVITAVGDVAWVSAGDKITVSGTEKAGFDIEYTVASISGQDITTSNDSSGFSGAAATYGIGRSSFNPTKLEEVYLRSRALSVDAQQFAFPLHLGFFKSHQLIPIKYMSGGLTLELELDTAANVTISGSTYPVIEEFALTGDFVKIEPSQDAEVQKMLDMGLPFYFTSFSNHVLNVEASVASKTLAVNEAASSVRSAFAVVRHATPTKANFNAFLKSDTGSIKEYLWKMGSEYYPSQYVNVQYSNAQQQYELLKALGLWEAHIGGGFDAGALDNSFIMGQNFVVHPDLISGRDLTSSGIPLHLQMILTTGFASAHRVDVFLQSDAFYEFFLAGRGRVHR